MLPADSKQQPSKPTPKPLAAESLHPTYPGGPTLATNSYLLAQKRLLQNGAALPGAGGRRHSDTPAIDVVQLPANPQYDIIRAEAKSQKSAVLSGIDSVSTQATSPSHANADAAGINGLPPPAKGNVVAADAGANDAAGAADSKGQAASSSQLSSTSSATSLHRPPPPPAPPPPPSPPPSPRCTCFGYACC